MPSDLTRRRFLQTTALAVASCYLPSQQAEAQQKREFQVSLSASSLARSINERKIDHLDLANIARTKYSIAAVEYASKFFSDKARDEKYLNDMNKRAADEGVRQLLIVVNSEGCIGHPEEPKRQQTVKNHHKWIDAAKALGCHSIEINPCGIGGNADQLKQAAEGIAALCEYAERQKINILLGSYGGVSANPKWLVELVRTVNRVSCGTLPSFDGFGSHDRYDGVAKLLPFAKGIGATARNFDGNGNEPNTDYFRMMKVVLDGGYRGYVGINYQGNEMEEAAGIRATKTLLKKIQAS